MAATALSLGGCSNTLGDHGIGLWGGYGTVRRGDGTDGARPGGGLRAASLKFRHPGPAVIHHNARGYHAMPVPENIIAAGPSGAHRG